MQGHFCHWWQELARCRLTAMNSLAVVILALAAITVFTVWFAWKLISIIKADGYGLRSSSGLPRDWAPRETPSTAYSVKPHF